MLVVQPNPKAGAAEVKLKLIAVCISALVADCMNPSTAVLTVRSGMVYRAPYFFLSQAISSGQSLSLLALMLKTQPWLG